MFHEFHEEFLEENAFDTSFDDDTPKEDSKRIFKRMLKKLSPIENWKTTLDEYEAQDQIIGKRYSIF